MYSFFTMNTLERLMFSVWGGVLGVVFGLYLQSNHPEPPPRQYVVLVTPTGVAVGEAKPGLDVDKVIDNLKSVEEAPKEKIFIPDRSGNNTF